MLNFITAFFNIRTIMLLQHVMFDLKVKCPSLLPKSYQTPVPFLIFFFQNEHCSTFLCHSQLEYDKISEY